MGCTVHSYSVNETLATYVAQVRCKSTSRINSHPFDWYVNTSLHAIISIMIYYQKIHLFSCGGFNCDTSVSKVSSIQTKNAA